MKPTFKGLLITLVAAGALFAFGLFMISLAHGDWLNGSMKLRSHTITYVKNKNEFVLRCAGVGLFGFSLFITGLALVASLLYRLISSEPNFFTEKPVKFPFLIRAAFPAGVLFLFVALVIMTFTQYYYMGS